jgi:pimeloyl-ACP methyl ester carboxylesterase
LRFSTTEEEDAMKSRQIISAILVCAAALVFGTTAALAQPKAVATDETINGVDPGVRLFVRQKMAAGNTRFSSDNVVIFIHGATGPSTCDFDLGYQDYSWADWMVSKGYVVYMFDKRNYGFSSREKAMDDPPGANPPLSRSYLVIRDIGAVVDHVRRKHGIDKVNLIGWSWGAMTGGYYTSLNTEKVRKLVMYAPAYALASHTNLGAGSALQNKRKPFEFNLALGAYRTASTAQNTARWDGEIPLADKSAYRDPAVAEAFWTACLATDPTSASRNPPALRAPNGVLEDSFMQATGRRIWNASSIYAPVLVIAGEYDTWSYPEDRELLMRDLTHAAAKKSVLIKDATHFVLFEKPRFDFFNEIDRFLKE